MIAGRRAPKASLRNPLKACLAHQQGHAVPPTTKPLIPQFGLDPKAPIGAGALNMNRLDFSQ